MKYNRRQKQKQTVWWRIWLLWAADRSPSTLCRRGRWSRWGSWTGWRWSWWTRPRPICWWGASAWGGGPFRSRGTRSRPAASTWTPLSCEWKKKKRWSLLVLKYSLKKSTGKLAVYVQFYITRCSKLFQHNSFNLCTILWLNTEPQKLKVTSRLVGVNPQWGRGELDEDVHRGILGNQDLLTLLLARRHRVLLHQVVGLNVEVGAVADQNVHHHVLGLAHVADRYRPSAEAAC